MNRRGALKITATLALASCGRRRHDNDAQLHFLHQPLWGDTAPFVALLDEFRRAHPEVPLVTRTVPSGSDVLHQYLLTTLEGGGDADVVVIDTIWVAEFARAGWIAELSDAFPGDKLREEFLPGAAESVVIEGKTWAVPWWIDVGVLYTRKDLVEPPRTFDELVERARRAGGYVWQGRQYEGLVCNVYEAIWGFGGTSMQGEHLAIDTKEAREALGYLASLVRDGVSPRAVTSAAEEECRRTFESGHAGLMRNWPYAFAELEKTSLRGRVAMTALPARDGTPGYGCLGGWQLAMASRVTQSKRAAAIELIRHLSSEHAQGVLARAFGRPPSRRALYSSTDQPLLTMLAPLVERARPRPVSAWYPRVSDALQGELSAIVSGIRSPAEGLSRAQRLIDHVMGEA
jgi:multiple sugar transport system substrate-binding protein